MPQHAHRIITHAHLVAFDHAGTIASDSAIVISDGRIQAIGETADILASWTADEVTDVQGRIVMPGLIDAHVHTAQTLMRGLLSTMQRTTSLRVPTWREYYVPFENALTPEDVELSGELCYATMLRSGTTTFLEAGGPHPERMAAAAERVGIRGVVSQSTMDSGSRIPSSMIQSTDQAIARNIEVADLFPPAADGSRRVTSGMSLRQIITCSNELVTTVHHEARTRGIKVHTHLLEGTYEIDFCLEQYGRRPVEHLQELGVFTDTLHAAHAVLTDDSEISAFARSGASVCHCAKGNYAIGAAPALRMWRRGVSVGLGTDGVATLGTLDLFRVAMLARVGQQLIEGTPSHNRNSIAPDEPLALATIGGARAAGMEASIGSLEVGKRADMLVIGLDSPDADGYASPEAFLFECASGSDIRSVIVDGVTVVEEGRVTTVDTDRIRTASIDRQRELAHAIA